MSLAEVCSPTVPVILTPDIILFPFCFSVEMFNSSHWDTPNQQHKGPEGSGLQSQSAGSKQLLCEKHIEMVFYVPWPLFLVSLC